MTHEGTHRGQYSSDFQPACKEGSVVHAKGHAVDGMFTKNGVVDAQHGGIPFNLRRNTPLI